MIDNQPTAPEPVADAPAVRKRPHWVDTLILAAGELAFAVVAVPLYMFLVLPRYPEGALPGFVPVIGAGADSALSVLAGIGVLAVGIGTILLLPWLFGAEHFRVDAMDELIQNYTVLDFAIIYLATGFAEEFLFRVVFTDAFGLLIGALIFTAVHAAYWRKPFMMADVFLLALLLGALYLHTKSLLICAVVHFAYDFVVSILLKKGIVPIERKRALRA